MSALAAAGLLAAACSDGQSSRGSADAGGSGIVAAAVRYTTCMRSHGVHTYPYPDSSGQLPKMDPSNESQLGVSDSEFNSAQSACQRLWPYQGPTQSEQRQELADALTFARCMRAHGVPAFPDPTTDPSSGRVEFVLSSQDGIDTQSPQIQTTARGCEHGLPAYMLPGSPDGVEVTTSP
jgi:hypothetical protein